MDKEHWLDILSHGHIARERIAYDQPYGNKVIKEIWDTFPDEYFKHMALVKHTTDEVFILEKVETLSKENKTNVLSWLKTMKETNMSYDELCFKYQDEENIKFEKEMKKMYNKNHKNLINHLKLNIKKIGGLEIWFNSLDNEIIEQLIG